MENLPSSFFFFNDTATTEIYTLSLHDALPICFDARASLRPRDGRPSGGSPALRRLWRRSFATQRACSPLSFRRDRKSTRLNSSHAHISYAVFCLQKHNDIARLRYPRDLGGYRV